MKTHSLLLSLLIAILLLPSCSKEDDPVLITTNLGQVALQYSTSGTWSDVASNRNFALQYLIFNHEGGVGAQSLSWVGFTPARYVGLDYSTVEDWTAHTFMIPSKGGVAGVGTPYIVASWNTQENSTTPADTRSCRITYARNATSAALTFSPKEVYVELTSYTLSVILHGDLKNPPFTSGDYLLLTAHGVKDDGSETTADIYLADFSSAPRLLDSWTPMDLSPLGSIKELYFTLSSSRAGEYGVLTPPYFAIDRLTVKAPLP